MQTNVCIIGCIGDETDKGGFISCKNLFRLVSKGVRLKSIFKIGTL